IDGGVITSSCSNHMNSPLSYLDSGKIEKIEVATKLAPVSMGGDSLGGAIKVKTKENSYKNKLSIGSFFKSNNNNFGGSLEAEVASEKTSFSYRGFQERALNYKDGSGHT